MHEIAHAQKLNPLSNPDTILEGGRYPKCNHLCLFMWQSVKGLASGRINVALPYCLQPCECVIQKWVILREVRTCRSSPKWRHCWVPLQIGQLAGPTAVPGNSYQTRQTHVQILHVTYMLINTCCTTLHSTMYHVTRDIILQIISSSDVEQLWVDNNVLINL